MGLDNTSCIDVVNGVSTTLTAGQCRDKYLKWLVGLDNGTRFGRCKPPANVSPAPTFKCNLLGDIYHATPRIVNAPKELTRDDTYQAFQGGYADAAHDALHLQQRRHAAPRSKSRVT